ncbi:hypothetical protein MF271_14385 [Deinococcus sp. KNUC1210]|uniref:hypothetical protein n=1 Tax=Deinococcus sp. KNUC1210 TaxID=2917691 RepID=UPI001EF09029|nr:hypothetical protein [Deinococcus sp. KNUC1210]ULH15129.1 hypothetical protein MF271_14385 [Deinococcus sp. KNUC1210]
MIESSPEEFTERHRHYAAHGLIYPQPEGSPLIEFVAGGRVLYLLDRCGPYVALPGEAYVIVNGVVSAWARLPEAPPEEQLGVVGVSGLEGVGQVLACPRGGPPTVVVRARLTLVLSGYTPFPELAPGDWISFTTEAPLHGFVLTGQALYDRSR